MLSQWRNDPGPTSSAAENALPFVRSGGGAGRLSSRHGGDDDPAFDVDPSSVVEAHRHATQAEELRWEGQLAEALQEHLEASHCFLEAAERLHDAHGVVRTCVDLAVAVGGSRALAFPPPPLQNYACSSTPCARTSPQTASALVLLSDGHARQAKMLQQLLRKGDSPEPSKNPPRPPPAVAHPPPPPKPGGLAAEGSMYSSTMMGSTASTTVVGVSQVEDMLALERALQAIGSQPLFSTGTYQPGSGGGGGGGGGGSGQPRYLSSTLGDSFFLVTNRHAAAREGAASMQWEGGSMMGSKHGVPPSRGSGPLRAPHNTAGAVAGGRGGTLRDSRHSHGNGPPTPLAGPPPSSSSSSSVAPASEGGGGFLGGVEAVQQGEVMRLLGCMKTLGDENAVLIKQVEESARVRQESERVRREMAEFTEKYARNFKELRIALEEFRQKYPHDANPANHVRASQDLARIKNLEAEVENLMLRFNREKELNRKKDAMLKKYEQWYQTLRGHAKAAKQQQQQQGAVKPVKTAAGGGGGGGAGKGTRPTTA